MPAGLGVEAKKKTRTVLNRLWLEPRAELVDYDRGVAIYKAQPDIPVAALCWGMAVATYPFFRQGGRTGGPPVRHSGRLRVRRGASPDE
jgi:hypothetical protein